MCDSEQPDSGADRGADRRLTQIEELLMHLDHQLRGLSEVVREVAERLRNCERRMSQWEARFEARPEAEGESEGNESLEP